MIHLYCLAVQAGFYSIVECSAVTQTAWVRSPAAALVIKIFHLLQTHWSEIQDGYYVVHLEKLFWASSPEPKSHLAQNLVENIRVTWRSKIAKMVHLEIQYGHGGHHENLFWTSHEGKGQLTWNLVGSVGITCRSKVAKIVLIGIPRWLPQLLSWKSTMNYEQKGHLTWNLIGTIWVTCRSKLAKIIPIRNPSWLPQLPYWKSILNLERPINLKLHWKHPGDL